MVAYKNFYNNKYVKKNISIISEEFFSISNLNTI